MQPEQSNRGVPRPSRPIRSLLRRAAVALLAFCAAASGLRAQDPPKDAGAMARAMRDAVRAIAQLEGKEKRTEPEDQQLEQLRTGLKKLVERLLGDGADLTVEHYVETSSAMLEESRFQECLDISNAGLKQHQDSRFLLDHVGFARFALGVDSRPPAARQEHLQASEAAFRKALALTPETFHTHLGLYQLLSELDRPLDALAELDLALKDEAARKALGDPHLRRGALLLRGGKHKEALAELQGEGAQNESARSARVLALRALALSGDGKKAQEQVNALLKDDDSPVATAAAADVLFYLGKKDEAGKLLDTRPPVRMDGESQNEAKIRAQSHEALKALVRSKELGGEPLRQALTKALDHHMVLMDADKDGKPKQTDFSASPVCMSHLLNGIPRGEESAKAWANRILLVLCIKALPGYKPPAGEQKFLEMVRKGDPAGFPDKSHLPPLLQSMRRGVGDADDGGALTALRFSQKAEERPAPAKK